MRKEVKFRVHSQNDVDGSFTRQGKGPFAEDIRIDHGYGYHSIVPVAKTICVIGEEGVRKTIYIPEGSVNKN